MPIYTIEYKDRNGDQVDPETEELLTTVHEIAFQSMKQDHYWIAEALDLSDEAMDNVMQYLTQYLEGK